MIKKILVTGATGYIGSVLMPYLISRGMDCQGLDIGFFEDCLLYNPEPYPFVKCDMRSLDPAVLRGVSAVVHLAGISNDPFGNLSAEKVYDPTRVYAFSLAKLCRERGIKFVFASSCSVYGQGQEDFVDECSSLFPQTPYSKNKIQVEQDLATIAGKDFSVIILRFATAYGLSPRMRFDIVINMLAGMALTQKKIILNSDGMAWRPCVHVEDICRAVHCALVYPLSHDRPLVLNIGQIQDNYRILDIAQMVQAQVPGCTLQKLAPKKSYSKEEELIRDRKVQDGVDTRTYRVCFDHARDLLGFSCQWNVAAGIRDLVRRLDALKLSKEMFQNASFYRLQRMEYLYKNHFIDENLYRRKDKRALAPYSLIGERDYDGIEGE